MSLFIFIGIQKCGLEMFSAWKGDGFVSPLVLNCLDLGIDFSLLLFHIKDVMKWRSWFYYFTDLSPGP